MSKARQPGRRAMHEYAIGIAVLFALPVIYLALAPSPVIGKVATPPTRTPTATPVSQRFLPAVPNGDFQYYPPLFTKSYQGHHHADDLDCGDYRVRGRVYDKDGEYWIGQALLVRVSGDGFDETVPVSAEQSLYTPGYQGNIPDAKARYTVQLLEQDGTPASYGYPVFPNEGCFWNVICLSFQEQIR